MAVAHVNIDALICGSVGSSFTTATVNQVTGGILPDWIALAALAMVTSSTILVFLYVLATMLRNPNLTASVKFELYELVITLLIIVFIASFSRGVCNLHVKDLIPVSHQAILNGEPWGDYSIYRSAQTQFIVFSDFVRGWMELNYLLNFHLDQMASVTPYSRPLGVGMVAAPLAGFAAPFKQITYNSMTGLSLAYILNEAMLVVFESVLTAFLKWYIPIGLVLRSFTPTRRLGGTLIAIGCGFLFIFPVSVVITGIMFYDPANGELMTTSGQALSGFTDATGQHVTSSTQTLNVLLQKSGDFLGSITLKGFIDFLAGGFLSSIGGALQTMMGGIGFTFLFLLPINVAAQAVAIGYVMPAFNVLVLVQAVRDMSKSIGEEIDITALTRLI